MNDDGTNSDPEPPQRPGSAEGLEFIQWNEEAMGTGIPSVDAQHQELIRHLNELYRAHRAGVEPEDVKKILKFLTGYAETHFRHEETIMEERKCPLRRENRLAHARFLREYEELVSMYSVDDDTDLLVTEIEHMAGRWLSTHICRVDVALRDCPEPPATEPPKTGRPNG
jgi:hemerythrin